MVDLTAPILTSLSFNPASIDVLTSGAQVTVSANMTDDSSGIDYMQMRFSSPAGKWYYATFRPNQNGTFENQTINFPQGVNTGSYVINWVGLYDLAGNSRSYYESDLKALGFKTTLNVKQGNIAPLATSKSTSTFLNTKIIGYLEGKDNDGDALNFIIVDDAKNGNITLDVLTGGYTYTPKLNYSGIDKFTFKVNDGLMDSSFAQVEIKINAGYEISLQAYSWRGVALSGVLTGETGDNRTNGKGAMNLLNIEDRYESYDGFMILSPSLTALSTASSAGVTLTDVLAALKIYLGKSLPDAYASPYNYIAADFDGNGSVNLTDVLSLLKFYLGKTTTATPSWVFVDAADVTGTGKAASILRAGTDSLAIDVTHTQPHAIDQDFSIDSSIELVGVLRGDVDGSWAAGA